MIPQNKRKRFRKRHEFWLDLLKDEGLALDETIDTLKENRLYAKTIRDGIRLICDLRRGRIDVLLELFPGIVHQLQARPDSREVQQFQSLLEKHQRELLAKINANGATKSGPATGGPRKLDVPAIQVPTFDDDSDLELTIKKDTSTDAGKNFIASMIALQGGA